MSFIIFFTSIAILFTAFISRYALSILKNNDKETISNLKNEIEKEKNELQWVTTEVNKLKIRDHNANQRLLKIRLELLNIEDDFNELIPRLLN